ncbi:CocE/NonD family hydrolase [Oricola indica]|uniref:CocE/NonD family hydrolase n=1 Tax=Oricola indica TaxID=2872591 RepID=UPI003CCC081C
MTTFTYRFRPPLTEPAARGAKPPRHERQIIDGMLYEKDVAVTLPDGVTIHVDVFRPETGIAAPLIAWGPYGKHGHTRYSVNFPKAEVHDHLISDYTAFEAPDPVYWTRHGYAVINPDPRGTWHSEGRATYLSPEEARDFAALIEWAGTRPWSNGKVGLSGVSYLTSSQWRVAELNPPHLAAINPWEGWSDTYREVVRHGGIPETSFWDYLPGRWGHSVTEIEDLRLETAERPLFDAYWDSKRAKLDRIEVPAFVCASWTDQALHTRGTLEGFRRISSDRKWLYVHGRKKWAHYYEPRCVEMQRAFFDHFLQGKETEIAAWPPVLYELREKYYQGAELPARQWPIEDTQYRSLHLAPGALQNEPGDDATVSYDPTAGESLVFDHRFDEPVDLVGHMALRLWVSVDAGDDMDIFVAIQKLDADGNVVPFAYYAQFEDGPVALGWLRVSHRELDPDESEPHMPVLAHRREQKLTVGEIVPVDIEIWPSGTHFDAGEGLRLVVQGADIYDYPKPSVHARHEETLNAGRQNIHMGKSRPSRLLIPVINPSRDLDN